MNINGKPVKTIEWLGIVTFFTFLVTSFLNVPPASWFINAYCNLFETEKYPLILITLIPTAIILTCFVLIGKVIKK